MSKGSLSEKSFCIFSDLGQLFGWAPVCKVPCSVHVDFCFNYRMIVQNRNCFRNLSSASITFVCVSFSWEHLLWPCFIYLSFSVKFLWKPLSSIWVHCRQNGGFIPLVCAWEQLRSADKLPVQSENVHWLGTNHGTIKQWDILSFIFVNVLRGSQPIRISFYIKD